MAAQVKHPLSGWKETTGKGAILFQFYACTRRRGGFNCAEVFRLSTSVNTQ
jgi:hypothetical protein